VLLNGFFPAKGVVFIHTDMKMAYFKLFGGLMIVAGALAFESRGGQSSNYNNYNRYNNNNYNQDNYNRTKVISTKPSSDKAVHKFDTTPADQQLKAVQTSQNAGGSSSEKSIIERKADNLLMVHQLTSNQNPLLDRIKGDLAAGRNIDGQDSQGETYLHQAVRANQPEVVKYLLDRCADPALPNRAGLTPLQLAQQLRLQDVVAELQKK
jgi:hypothetical protein